MRQIMATVLLLLVAGTLTAGDGSSLLKSGKSTPPPVLNDRGVEITPTSQPTVANVSMIAVEKPKFKEFKIHDIVTIVVNESSQSNTNTEGKIDRKGTAAGQITDWVKFTGGHMGIANSVAANPPSLAGTTTENVDNKGTATRSDSYQTKIAATIIDVKPNGTLVIQAQKSVKMDDEEISMTLTGIIRPGDIAADNTVVSSSVAELATCKTTKGIGRDGQKMGWLVKLLSFLNPF
jgi:flagellar L-ring protein precursor FlgH